MREKADSDLVRRQNRSLVLQALRQAGPMARIELGRATGLSPASITSITGQLLQEGLLRESEDNATAPLLAQKRGRPMVKLTLDPKAARVVMVKLSIDGIELVLADYSGAILQRELLPVATSEAEAARFGLEVAEAISAFLRRHRVKRTDVSRITVAIQGLADSRSGCIVWSPAFTARNIELCGPVTRLLGIPCTIANDANMIAEGLLTTAPEQVKGTCAVVFVGYGVGMGLIINGTVFHGTTGAAAEFGHMNHVPGGPLCRCGRRGCIEAYAADYGIVRAARGLSSVARPSLTAVPPETMEKIEHAAAAGDETARTAFAAAGEALGFGIARLCAVLSLDHVLLAGPGTRNMPLMMPSLTAAFQEGVVEELRHKTDIAVVPVTTDMIVRGALSDALRQIDRDASAVGHEENPAIVVERIA